MNKLIGSIFLILICYVSLFANAENMVINYEKNRLLENPMVTVKSIKISNKKELTIKNWFAYVLDIKATIKDKEINVKDILFSNGEYITLDFFDLKTGESIKNDVKPNLTKEYYKSNKIIAGSVGAKNKIVIFSDPLCPFCKQFVPKIINKVKNNKNNNVVLYYYHYPLVSLHYASKDLSKLMEIATERGIKDVVLKTYVANWETYFDSNEKNSQKILNAFNKVFDLKITLKELEDKKIDDKILKDIKMAENLLINGTPTIYVNDKQDKNRSMYKKILK